MSSSTTERERELSRIRNRRYAAKKRAELNAKSRAWYAANKDKAKITRRKWREANAEKDRADIARYHAENKEHIREKSKQWVDLNRGAYNAKGAKHRAQRLQATPIWADSAAIRELYEIAQATTEIFEVPFHVDHIVPLRSQYVCGLHCEANLRVIPGVENQRKSNRIWPDM